MRGKSIVRHRAALARRDASDALGLCAALALCLVLLLSAIAARAAQDKPAKPDIGAKTVFLVARPVIGDPVFHESVVLLFPSSAWADDGVVVGLILNRPARVALSEIFPDDKALKDQFADVYFGGPVDPHVPGAVFRSSKPPEHSSLLFGDVYVTFDSDFIEKLLEKPQDTPDLHLFLGRAQWAPLQLEWEMDGGAWYSVHAETTLIFSTNSRFLWRNLFQQQQPSPYS